MLGTEWLLSMLPTVPARCRNGSGSCGKGVGRGRGRTTGRGGDLREVTRGTRRPPGGTRTRGRAHGSDEGTWVGRGGRGDGPRGSRGAPKGRARTWKRDQGGPWRCQRDPRGGGGDLGEATRATRGPKDTGEGPRGSTRTSEMSHGGSTRPQEERGRGNAPRGSTGRREPRGGGDTGDEGTPGGMRRWRGTIEGNEDPERDRAVAKMRHWVGRDPEDAPRGWRRPQGCAAGSAKAPKGTIRTPGTSPGGEDPKGDKKFMRTCHHGDQNPRNREWATATCHRGGEEPKNDKKFTRTCHEGDQDPKK